MLLIFFFSNFLAQCFKNYSVGTKIYKFFRGVGIGEIDYDLETKDWIELKSTYLNEKTLLPLLKLLVEIKKEKFRQIYVQKNAAQFISLPSFLWTIDRKITLLFHYFALIEKSASYLFINK